MVEVLENRGRLPVPWLRAESRVPAQLRFGAASLSEINGQMYHQSLFFLPPMSRITQAASRNAERPRGIPRGIRGAERRAIFWALAPRLNNWRPARKSWSIRGLLATRHPCPCSRFIGELLTRRFLHPDPCLFAGVRAYQPGIRQGRCIGAPARAWMS